MQNLLLGNELAHAFLRRAVEENKLGHAYLIYGEKGLGKQTFARFFAQSVLCTGSHKPCGECLSCRKVLSGNHPDVNVILGGETKGSIHIDAIREIRGDCVIKPNEGIRKIYLITNIQNMTQGAFNAFLKTLEEPPSHVLFLLTAPSLELLPKTIVSRLSLIPLYPLSDYQVRQALADRFPQSSEDAIDRAVNDAGGNLGVAEERLCKKDDLDLSDRADRLCQAISRKNEYDILCALTITEKDRKKLADLLSELILKLRRVMREQKEDGVDPDRSWAKNLTIRQSMALIEFLENGKQQLQLNANVSLMTVYLSSGIKQRIESWQ